MKISTGWEQAIYVLLILNQLPRQSVMTSTALSKRLKVSDSYLKKIVKALVKENLVYSTTGKNGGFTLRKKLKDITFYDVFLAIEGRGNIFSSQHLLTNFLGEKEGHKAQQCNISIALNHIEHTLISTLSNINLDDIYQDIIKLYNLEDITQWIVLNSKTL